VVETNLLKCPNCNKQVISFVKFLSAFSLVWRIDPRCPHCEQNLKIRHYVMFEYCLVVPFLMFLSNKIWGVPVNGFLDLDGTLDTILSIFVFCIIMYVAYLPNKFLKRRLVIASDD
jgi:hypothetical protein